MTLSQVLRWSLREGGWAAVAAPTELFATSLPKGWLMSRESVLSIIVWSERAAPNQTM